MKTRALCLLGAILTVLPLYGQHVKRHPGDILHYNVMLADGDIDKVTNVAVSLRTEAPETPKQPGLQNTFGGQCKKSSDPKVWGCDITIPQNVRDGDYRLYAVGVSSNDFSSGYNEDFHVPLVPIENTGTFTPPSKVTVTERP